MPRLRVLAGPSLEELVPIEINSDKAFDIKSDAFEGQAAVYIKGFADPNGNVGDSPYFSQEGRTDVTWSIQVQGRFLQPHSANDVMFGNTFDRPLQLPWGFSAVLGFMQYIDPTLEQDLASQTKPWALSPLIATMPYFAHARMDELHKVPPFPPINPTEENISELRVKSESGEESVLDPTTDRKTYFRSVENRQSVTFGPKDLITTDFCYNYLDFSPDGVMLRIPGGLTFDMMKYWDGQPVRFVCCERKRPGDGSDVPWGRVFWCVAIEAVDYDESEEGEEIEDEGSQEEEID